MITYSCIIIDASCSMKYSFISHDTLAKTPWERAKEKAVQIAKKQFSKHSKCDLIFVKDNLPICQSFTDIKTFQRFLKKLSPLDQKRDLSSALKYASKKHNPYNHINIISNFLFQKEEVSKYQTLIKQIPKFSRPHFYATGIHSMGYQTIRALKNSKGTRKTPSPPTDKLIKKENIGPKSPSETNIVDFQPVNVFSRNRFLKIELKQLCKLPPY